jgi:hypothetical protein
MSKIFRNTLALSSAVATLILLVVSVVLSSAVAYFAFNTTGARLQSENLYFAKSYVWYKNSTSSLACLVVTNTGASAVVLSRVTVKGQEIFWNGTTTYVLYNKTEGVLSPDLEFVSNLNQTGTNVVNLGGTDYTLIVASENLILQSGWTMLFYIVNPGKLMVYDVGIPIRVAISTGQSVYVTETIGKAA